MRYVCSEPGRAGLGQAGLIAHEKHTKRLQFSGFYHFIPAFAIEVRFLKEEKKKN